MRTSTFAIIVAVAAACLLLLPRTARAETCGECMMEFQKVRAKCGDVCYCKKSKDPSCDEGACKVCFDKEVQPVQKRCHGLCREAYKTVKV